MPYSLLTIRASNIKNIYSSGSYDTASSADKLFDNNINTGWNSYLDDAQGNTFVTIELYTKAALQKIIIKGISSISGSSYGLRNYKIYGSNDNVMFVELYSGSHANDDKDEVVILNASKNFTFYKFESLNSWYDKKRVAFRELEYYVYENYSREKILLSSNNRIYATDSVPKEINLIPAMTSNTSPSGVASASSTYGSGNNAYHAFDRNNSHWLTGSVGGKATLSYQFSNPQIVSAYSLRYYASYNSHNLKDWSLEAGNDGTNWNVLDVQYGVGRWEPDIKKVFIFKNNTPYLYYRLNITASSSGTYIALGEMELFESEKYLLSFSNYTEKEFINYGLDDLNLELLQGEVRIEKNTHQLGNGKTFEHSIDLSNRRVDKIILN